MQFEPPPEAGPRQHASPRLVPEAPNPAIAAAIARAKARHRFKQNADSIPTNDRHDVKDLEPIQSRVVESKHATTLSEVRDETKEMQKAEITTVISPIQDLAPGDSQGLLSVFVGTWNLHAKDPPSNLEDFIPPNKYDLYVIGTEECENSIEASLIFSGKEKWTATVHDLLGPHYREITQHTLQAMHIIVMIRNSLWGEISLIDSDDVATGFGDIIGNKGGVGVCFDVGDTSFLFIASHFQAHQENVGQRNADFAKINSKMTLRQEQDNKDSVDTLCDERFDRVFWCGDLNYRINGNRAIVDAVLEKGMMEVLRNNDQLRAEMTAGNVFQGYIEGPLGFAPTYKFDAGTDNYDTSSKQRIPSWTDRILFKPNPRNVLLREYNSVNTIKTSDHRPVYATFDVIYDKAQKKKGKLYSAQSALCTIQ